MWPATGTPVLATFISGLAAALAALLIQLEVLVEMMSIGKPARHSHVCLVVLGYLQTRSCSVLQQRVFE